MSSGTNPHKLTDVTTPVASAPLAPSRWLEVVENRWPLVCHSNAVRDSSVTGLTLALWSMVVMLSIPARSRSTGRVARWLARTDSSCEGTLSSRSRSGTRPVDAHPATQMARAKPKGVLMGMRADRPGLRIQLYVNAHANTRRARELAGPTRFE